MGNLLIVGASICNAINSLIQKQILNEGHHPLVVQFYVCCIGMVSYITGYSGFGLFQHQSWVIPGNVWIYISIVGVVATAIPWCVSIIALKHTSPMTTSVYVVLQPLIAGFVGVILMGEVLTWIQMIGGSLVILGLVLVNAQPIVQRLFFRSKQEFALLPSAEEDTKQIELKIISEDTKPEEVNYELAPKGDTNAFVIEDGADYKEAPEYFSDADDKPDYKPVEGIFTPEFIRHKHAYEDAEGYNFSVTLHKSLTKDGADYKDTPEIKALDYEEASDYKEGSDYNYLKEANFYAASCKDLSAPPTPILRAVS